MHILTFNHHETVISLLAHTGYELDVVDRYKDLDLTWSPRARPVPKNVHLCSFDKTVSERLANGYYDVVICHTIMNLLWMWRYKSTRYIFIAHIYLFQHNLFFRLKSWVKKKLFQLFAKTHKIDFVAVSEGKYQSWGIKGTVIKNVPGTMPERQQFDPTTEDITFMVIGNRIKERGPEAGYEKIECLRKKYNLMIVGNNPDIPNAFVPKNYDEFVRTIVRGQVYLFLIEPGWDEGYNLGMLEAMKLGMPVITLVHSRSLVIHGVNGYIAKNLTEVEHYINELQNHPEKIESMGKAAKELIDTEFQLTQFIASWRQVLQKQPPE